MIICSREPHCCLWGLAREGKGKAAQEWGGAGRGGRMDRDFPISDAPLACLAVIFGELQGLFCLPPSDSALRASPTSEPLPCIRHHPLGSLGSSFISCL